MIAAFDRAASTYDAQWTDTAIGRAQRNLVWRCIDRIFQAGDRVLDIGCGTGEDAKHLANRGVRVHAIDASPAMIALAASRGGFSTEVRTAEEIISVAGTFDGALSNFGALNCVEDWAALAAGLAERIRPGGRLVICTLGKFCLWEALYYGLRLNFRRALRRSARGTIRTSLGISVHYPTVRQMTSAFAPHFRSLGWTGVGVFVPPSYVRLPDGVVRLCEKIDRAVADWPVLRAMADHRMVVLVRE